MASNKIQGGTSYYTRPVIVKGSAINSASSTEVVLPSDFGSESNILFKWNETDTTQFPGVINFHTTYDPAPPDGGNKNATNGGTFSLALSYRSTTDDSGIGPRLRVTGTGANGVAPRPTNNQGGWIASYFTTVPRRFVLEYRIAAISSTANFGFGFFVGNTQRGCGYVHLASATNTTQARYNPAAAGSVNWPFTAPGSTLTLANVTNLISSGHELGAVYQATFDFTYGISAGPPLGLIGLTCPTTQNTSNVANQAWPTQGAAASLLGNPPSSDFNNDTYTQLGFLLRFPNPGNVTNQCDISDLRIIKHPMDQT